MAYESTISAAPFELFGEAPEAATAKRVKAAPAGDEFRGAERLVVVVGASVGGMLAGFVAAIAFGRVPMWMPMLAALPLFLTVFYLSLVNFRDAWDRRTYGCASASVFSIVALLAWPSTAFLYPMHALEFWIAPLSSVVSLLLLASRWDCSQRAIYRFCVQGAMVAIGLSYLGALSIF